MTDEFDVRLQRLLRAFDEYAQLRSRQAPLTELVASAEELYNARACLRGRG